MTQDIRDHVPGSAELFALGEPTHLEPAFARLRNEFLPLLAERGFRSIALETDRVAAFAIDDYVRHGVGSLETVLAQGFSHTFGGLAPNERLVAWMREHNETRPNEEQWAFHGFDIPTETMSAPSPRRCLEHVRDYLGLELDLARLAGDDERWSRTEAVLDPAESPGTSPEAEQLRCLADDMVAPLYARAPELIAASSRDEWFRAEAQLSAGLDLLRYHRETAQRIDERTRLTRMCATRDALMARNLLDIRRIEAGRGPTFVFSHNLHLQRNRSTMRMGGMDIEWSSAGAIVGSLLGERYTFIAGSLGRSETIGLGEPGADTYEGQLQANDPWYLTKTPATGGARTDVPAVPGYFPLDKEILDTSDAILHVSDATAID